MSPGKEPASLLAEAWRWPVDVTQYDCSPALSPAERETMTRLVARFRAGGKSWHPGARSTLERLLLPLHAALNHIGAGNAIKHKYPERTTVICLLVRAMHREDCAFWAFPTPVWHALLGRDYDAYARRHGAKANGRQQLVAVAYLLCGFNDLGALGRLAHYSLATKVFGKDRIDAAVADVLADLRTWGYTQSGNTVAVRNALAEALLARRSPRLADLTLAGLAELHRVADAKITRRGLVLLSYVLTRRGLIPEPLGRDGRGASKEHIEHRRAADGVPPAWRQWCERWFATSTLQQSSRISACL